MDGGGGRERWAGDAPCRILEQAARRLAAGARRSFELAYPAMQMWLACARAVGLVGRCEGLSRGREEGHWAGGSSTAQTRGSKRVTRTGTRGTRPGTSPSTRYGRPRLESAVVVVGEGSGRELVAVSGEERVSAVRSRRWRDREDTRCIAVSGRCAPNHCCSKSID